MDIHFDFLLVVVGWFLVLLTFIPVSSVTLVEECENVKESLIE